MSETETSEFIEIRTMIRRRRRLKVAYNKLPGEETKIPTIRFSGAWLEDLGFMVKGQFDLCVNEDSSITLTPVLPAAVKVADGTPAA